MNQRTRTDQPPGSVPKTLSVLLGPCDAPNTCTCQPIREEGCAAWIRREGEGERTHTTTQAFQHSGRPTVYIEVLKYPL